jgi:hypothetical protein
MIPKTSNPAALADAGRARNSFNCLATLNGSENSQSPPEIQERRAAFIARRCRISRDVAGTIALLAFGELAP